MIKTKRTLNEVSDILNQKNIKLGASGIRQDINKSFEKIIYAYAKNNEIKIEKSKLKELSKDLEIQELFVRFMYDNN
jgi:hypothetical protein